MSGNNSPWRLFCAIEIPAEVRRQLSTRTKLLRELSPEASASWTREENFHLTLKFVGEVDSSLALSLSEATGRAAATATPFEILIEKPGAFPKRVLWIGISDPSGELFHLQQQLDRECAAKGFPKEERAFHPHLTVARLRKPQGTQALITTHKEMPFESAVVQVNDLVVIRSQLSNKGSIYTIVSRHNLRT
jgi:2'-5' RNA ligase